MLAPLGLILADSKCRKLDELPRNGRNAEDFLLPVPCHTHTLSVSILLQSLT